MKRLIAPLFIGAWILSLALAQLSAAQALRARGQVIVPQSSIESPADVSVRAHTNVRMLVPSGGLPALQPEAVKPAVGAPPFPGFFYETPASLACVYELVTTLPAGCNPNTTTENPAGGANAIAVVDAYHDATAASDLKQFSNQFGLPPANFKVVFATGVKPAVDPTGGWELEESLDIELTHAMAPLAKIFLVEAKSNTLGDLLKAEAVASTLVAANGGGEVENGWGGSEFSGESSFDSRFTTSGVVYVAAAGDSPGVEYPAASPNVVAVGGTSISRNPSTGAFEGESAWQLTGGGPSAFETRPAYQDSILAIVGAARGTPDLSLDGDPDSGVWVYDSKPINGVKGWFIVGGTSVSSAAVAGILNAANQFYASTYDELTAVYGNLGNASDFRDITSGNCGPYIGYQAATGWDFCTGVGSDLGLLGK